MNVTRTGLVLRPDPARVLYRPLNLMGDQRPLRIIARILSLSETEVGLVLSNVRDEFHTRHLRLLDYFLTRYESVRHLVPTDQPLSNDRKLLIGAYFTHEYSLEAAALFNPSIVPHPDQQNLPEGSLRFVLSLRATGEGHISSITFRSGSVDAHGKIEVEKPTRYVTAPEQIPRTSYDKAIFYRKLQELGLADDIAEALLGNLGDNFTMDEANAYFTSLEFAENPHRRDLRSGGADPRLRGGPPLRGSHPASAAPSRQDADGHARGDSPRLSASDEPLVR